MKQRDLKNCALCDRGLMHGGRLTFFRLLLEYMLINTGAVMRQHGLELSVGKAAPLAVIMGPDENLAEPVGERHEVLICLDCAVKPNILFGIFEKVNAEKKEEAA